MANRLDARIRLVTLFLLSKSWRIVQGSFYSDVKYVVKGGVTSDVPRSIRSEEHHKTAFDYCKACDSSIHPLLLTVSYMSK